MGVTVCLRTQYGIRTPLMFLFLGANLVCIFVDRNKIDDMIKSSDRHIQNQTESPGIHMCFSQCAIKFCED